jgi:hypothetical protein
MTPIAKQPAQSSGAKIIINAEISFRRRVSSKANQRISTCPLAVLAIALKEAPKPAPEIRHD